jgi:hypothetical protein
VLCVLLRIPLPAVTVPNVLGVGGFALRRGLVYARAIVMRAARRAAPAFGRNAWHARRKKSC